MLLQIRKLTRGAIATIILALVGIAMVIFLIPQGMQLLPSQNVATVGDRTIAARELSRELDLTLRQERSQGNMITQEEAIAAGVHLQLLESMIARYAMYEYADKLGISAGDATVAERIRQIPQVSDPVTGRFSRAAYNDFLQRLGYSEEEFLHDVRGDLTTGMLVDVIDPRRRPDGALIAGVRAPSSFGALAFAYETETRVVTLAEATAAAVGDIPAPTEAQLQTAWEQNSERLRVPEYRAITLVYADPQDFVARVAVPESRLREEFEARRAALTRPEQRTYVRLSAQNQQQASEAAARLSRGEPAQAVAQALSMQLNRGENQSRNEVPDRAVADAVFSMQPGQARAVQGALGPWVAVRLESVTAAVEPNFETARQELRETLALAEANDLLSTAMDAFEDARAAGTPIAEAARSQNLRVVTIPAVDAEGMTPEGEPVMALIEHRELMRAAFQTLEGEASDFTPLESADVLVAVDRVTPSRVRPLSEVRELLVQYWLTQERGRRLRELASDMTEAVRGGQDFAAAARAHRFSVVQPRSQEVNRAAAQRSLPPALAGQIFAARQGEMGSVVAPDASAVLVAHVERINRVDPAEHPQVVEQLRAQVQQGPQGLASSFASVVQSDVLARTRVRRNERVLNQRFQRPGAEDEALQ